MDAHQRQLKRSISGWRRGFQQGGKSFSDGRQCGAFPQNMYRRAVRQGMEQEDVLPAIVAAVTNIDAMGITSTITSDLNADEKIA